MFREQELIIEMHVEGTPIDHFLSFSLSQSFNAHHYFELRMEHGKLGLPGLVSLEQTREFVGRKLFISFGYAHANLQNFGGLITQVSLSQSNGFQGAIVISGYSPSILIDRGSDLGSYLDTSLGDIARAATKDAGDGLKLAIKPSRTAPLDYLIQYKESDFEFLNRLSASYYEWFYYDGEQLNFGKPDELKSGTLTYGREIKSLDYGIHIAPIKHKRFFYDAKEDELMDSESSGKAQGHPDLLHAVDRSNETYGKTFHQPANPRIDSVGDLNDFVKYEEQANVSQLLRVNAESDSPVVALGSEIQIDTSVRQELSFVTDTLGKFLVTRVEHHFDGVGHYTNRFEGVSAGSERLPVTNFKTPSPDLQVADVVNNDDPKGQGRVKVKFKWPCQTNDETEWLRVLTPDAGSSSDVSTNRGFVFVPEIGDQVIVGFEEGNIAKPVVMGSVFHGKTGTGGGGGNNSKNLVSKSGHAMRMDDGGSFSFMDKSKLQHITMDGTNKMTIEAGEQIAIQSGSSSIVLNSNGTIDLIGTNINIIGSANINVNAECTGMAEGAEAPSPGAKVSIGASGLTELDAKVTKSSLMSDNEVIISGGSKVDIDGAGGTIVAHGQVDIN